MIRCAMLRHAEMPQGSRRVPPVYDGFILGPPHRSVGRLVFLLQYRRVGDAHASPILRVHLAIPAKLNVSIPFCFAANKLVLPRLFHIGNFSLPTYGLLVALGVLIGLWISVRNSEK